MNKLQNLFYFFLLVLILVSCGLTETKKNNGNTTKNKIKNKYTKKISDSTNVLSDKVEDLEIEYTVWGCACPNWIQSKDNVNIDSTKNYLKQHFYIEPSDKNIELPIYFDAFRHRLKVTGQFYEREDYPQGTIELEEPMPKAKVFRYTKIKVIDKSDFKPDSKIETLTLMYNAISCNCAKWSKIGKNEIIDTNQYYWLEPANEKLNYADNLFDGENLPLIIKVTGQVVTENGFPKRDLAKVGQDEAGKVFRYSKIEVIQNGKKKNGR